ncbi:thioredoxin-like protein [Pelagophyceae sp. CCMP2097]|nr:thioredoxin-like protein [Pelagophyceae sp. CCMP2097]
MPDAGFGDETLDVRAPDQVKHQRLVGGFGDDADAAAAAYAAASQPAALAGAFADFSDEAADASPASDAPTPRPDGSGPPRPDTLATLYAAPRRLMFAGDFQAARQAGKQERKWLLVVITNDAVFKCHEMNRDVWTDETVQAVVEAQFILWFRQHVDTEAGTYTDRYDKDRVVPCLDSDGVETCHPAHPHLAVIDPRTGRRVWMREGALSAERVVELLGDVCDRYSLDDEPQALRVPSPAVRPQAARDLPPPAPLAPVAPPPPPADLTPPPWDSVVLV